MRKAGRCGRVGGMEPPVPVVWTDCHNHLISRPLARVAPVLAEMRAAGVVRAVVNSTCEAEWEPVAALAAEWPETVVPAFGIHPWHAGGVGEGWVERLAARLAAQPTALLGECGLDGSVAVAMAEQRAVFLAQLGLARRFGRAVSIHCVRGWVTLFESLATEPPPRFLMHAFGGSVELARRLAGMGAWFSCNGAMLDPRRRKTVEVFRHLPADRILLESDAPHALPPADWVSHPLPDGANHPANLPRIGAGWAAALGMAPAALAALTEANGARFLG